VERRVIDDDKKVLQAAKLFWKGEAIMQRNWSEVWLLGEISVVYFFEITFSEPFRVPAFAEPAPSYWGNDSLVYRY
jgi:hypothetical protein